MSGLSEAKLESYERRQIEIIATLIESIAKNSDISSTEVIYEIVDQLQDW